MPHKRLWLAGAGVFLIGIIALFPARVAYHWFAPAGVAVSGFAGTVWSGSASEAAFNHVYLRDLSWQFRPLRLLTGRFAYQVGASPGGGFLSAETGVSLGGALLANDLRGSLPLAALQGATGIDGLGGTVNADISRIKVVDGVPVAADGSVEVSSLLVPLVSRSTVLGSFRADLVTQDDGVVASIQDMQAVVDIAGRFLLKPGRDYEFLGKVAPTGQTPDGMRRQFRYLGSPNDQGEYELRLAGRL